VGAAVGSVTIAMSGEASRLHLVGRCDGVPVGTAARTVAVSRLVEAAALGVLLMAFVLIAIVAGGGAATRAAVNTIELTGNRSLDGTDSGERCSGDRQEMA
jgi:hypothetical protein